MLLVNHLVSLDPVYMRTVNSEGNSAEGTAWGLYTGGTTEMALPLLPNFDSTVTNTRDRRFISSLVYLNRNSCLIKEEEKKKKRKVEYQAKRKPNQ